METQEDGHTTTTNGFCHASTTTLQGGARTQTHIMSSSFTKMGFMLLENVCEAVFRYSVVMDFMCSL